MLKQLLKYEFKATKRLYFGLYLALALLSVVLGVTFRQEHALAHSTSFQNLEVILMIVYVSVILAIAVLCFVNTIQRFYKNLLGREGYLMHTLPVTETQLILSKLITSMVWVLCSGLVGIVCITVMVSCRRDSTRRPSAWWTGKAGSSCGGCCMGNWARSSGW